jgi:hypothetical protein
VTPRAAAFDPDDTPPHRAVAAAPGVAHDAGVHAADDPGHDPTAARRIG